MDRRVLKLTLVMFGIITISAVIYATFSQNNQLLISGDIYYGMFISVLLTSIFLGLDVFVMLAFTTRKISISMLLWSLFYGFIFQLIPRLNGLELFMPAAIPPLLAVLVYGISTKQFKPTMLRYIIFTLSTNFYHIAWQWVKLGYISFTSIALTEKQRINFQFDYLFLLTVILLIGGVLYEKETERARLGKLELYVVPSSDKSASQDGRDCSGESSVYFQEYQRLTGFSKVIAGTVKIGYQCIQWALTLLVCALGSVFIRGFMLTFAFACYSFIFVKRWHPRTLISCTLLTSAIFFLVSSLLPSLTISWFLPIIAALLLMCILHNIGKHTAKFSLIENQLDNLFQFDPETADITELEERCIEKGLNDSEISFCIKVFKSGLTHGDIANELGISIQAVRKRKKRMRDRLIK